MVEINKNFHNLEKSTTLAINEKSNELLSQGREVYKFGLGQSPFPVPESVAEELQKKARRVAKRLRSGVVYINGHSMDSGTPFGGYRQSGNGREGGKWGLDEYLEVKTITGWV